MHCHVSKYILPLIRVWAVVKVTGKEGTKKWVTPREAAKELGLSIRTIYDLIHDGRVQARERRSLTGNRRFWLIAADEIERLRKLKGE
jgi:excisionase family DNA binding protein